MRSLLGVNTAMVVPMVRSPQEIVGWSGHEEEYDPHIT